MNEIVRGVAQFAEQPLLSALLSPLIVNIFSTFAERRIRTPDVAYGLGVFLTLSGVMIPMLFLGLATDLYAYSAPTAYADHVVLWFPRLTLLAVVVLGTLLGLYLWCASALAEPDDDRRQQSIFHANAVASLTLACAAYTIVSVH